MIPKASSIIINPAQKLRHPLRVYHRYNRIRIRISFSSRYIIFNYAIT